MSLAYSSSSLINNQSSFELSFYKNDFHNKSTNNSEYYKSRYSDNQGNIKNKQQNLWQQHYGENIYTNYDQKKYENNQKKKKSFLSQLNEKENNIIRFSDYQNLCQRRDINFQEKKSNVNFKKSGHILKESRNYQFEKQSMQRTTKSHSLQQNFKSKTKNPKKFDSSQYHKKLSTIYFTLSHENQLIQNYKKVINNRKQQIHKKFTNLIKQISNMIEQYQFNCVRKLDESVKDMIRTIMMVRQKSGIIFKDRLVVNQMKYTDEKIQNRHQHIVNMQRERIQKNNYKTQILQSNSNISSFLNSSSSKYYHQPGYNNKLLLKELSRQDKIMQEFHKVNNFYCNQQVNKQIDRVYQMSVQISQRSNLNQEQCSVNEAEYIIKSIRQYLIKMKQQIRF